MHTLPARYSSLHPVPYGTQCSHFRMARLPWRFESRACSFEIPHGPCSPSADPALRRYMGKSKHLDDIVPPRTSALTTGVPYAKGSDQQVHQGTVGGGPFCKAYIDYTLRYERSIRVASRVVARFADPAAVAKSIRPWQRAQPRHVQHSRCWANPMFEASDHIDFRVDDC